MARSRSSGQWLREHFDDPYVKQAQKLGYRSRASFKLLELVEKYRLLRRGMTVIDLGAAPGGWSQVAMQMTGEEGRVIAIDRLPMEPIGGGEFIEGDFTEAAALDQLRRVLGGQPVDLVLSDMAPNSSGNRAVDQPRAMELAELALDFAQQALTPGGAFIAKLFQGEGFDGYLGNCRTTFEQVRCVKPKASRPRSPEVYLVGTGFRGQRPVSG
ncbi:MAG TPA: 23S rRNA (uridine(2552)-2'-O)-methyltransferase RlmE [Pseudomonadales bacterium]|nr:23S rRNA (uridine(2552)-2'-O)-methyltransferase RlmE [Pseudomonadales bacterium]